MARRQRLESEAGVYHVINRGNYRMDLFRSDKTKTAFLKCLGETCQRTGWLVHAWCIMSNHYHLAISTPRANLVEGKQPNTSGQDSGHCGDRYRFCLES